MRDYMRECMSSSESLAGLGVLTVAVDCHRVNGGLLRSTTQPQTVESNPPEPGRPASPPAGFHQADEHRPRPACRQAFRALRLTQRCCQSAAAACWRAGTHAPTAARRDWHRRVGGKHRQRKCWFTRYSRNTRRPQPASGDALFPGQRK